MTTTTEKKASRACHIARLELTIDGDRYSLRRHEGRWRVSRVGARGSYQVEVLAGRVTCDCTDYQLRRAKAGERCKHGRALVAVGIIADPA